MAKEKRKLTRLLGIDPQRLRGLVPRRGRQMLYDRILARERAEVDPLAASIEVSNFDLVTEGFDGVLDLVAICRGSR